METHETKKLESLIDFKEDSINAAVVAKNNDFKALLIAIKKNQTMKEHKSPLDAFLYVIEGEIEFILNDCKKEKFIVKKGEIFKFKANEMHSVFGRKDSKILVVRI